MSDKNKEEEIDERVLKLYENRGNIELREFLVSKVYKRKIKGEFDSVKNVDVEINGTYDDLNMNYSLNNFNIYVDIEEDDECITECITDIEESAYNRLEEKIEEFVGPKSTEQYFKDRREELNY